MNIRGYWTKVFKKERGELDDEDKEVLENTIEFFEASRGISNLF